jgi:hypothetical protein
MGIIVAFLNLEKLLNIMSWKPYCIRVWSPPAQP